jgi:hypothetical protein
MVGGGKMEERVRMVSEEEFDRIVRANKPLMKALGDA